MNEPSAADACRLLYEAATSLEMFKVEVGLKGGDSDEIADMCTEIRDMRRRIQEIDRETR